MNKNTINNQELVKEYCGACGHINLLKNEYALQSCEKCKSAILITDAKDIIKVTSIEEIYNVNVLGDIYDFQMSFCFENDEEINEFFDNEVCPYHLVYCEVEFKDGVFNMNTAKCGISLNAEYSFEYKFSKEQLLKIKNNVIEYILSNNLGRIKGRDKLLLETVCDYYGCGLTIAYNSVVSEDFIDAEFKYVSDALIQFYKDFLKEDWNIKSDLDYIEELIEEKAFNTVLNWMDSYAFQLISKTKNNNSIEMVVKDLQAIDDEHSLIEKSLDYWCNYFIEEIYKKSVPEELRKEWILNDANPMKDYLDRSKSLKSDSNYLDIDNNDNLESKKISNFVNSTKFEIKYQLELSLKLENEGCKIYSDFPIIVLLEDNKLEALSSFLFIKNKYSQSFELIYCENINDERIYAKDIRAFINMLFEEFYKSCVELCENSIDSYIKFDNKIYEINNIIDFLKLDDLKDVEVCNINFNFDIDSKENMLLRKYINQYSNSKFGEVLSAIKKEVIFDKDIEVVAKKYAKYVLNLTDTQLIYMDYRGYFRNEVSYYKIDDYIVVYI